MSLITRYFESGRVDRNPDKLDRTIKSGGFTNKGIFIGVFLIQGTIDEGTNENRIKARNYSVLYRSNRPFAKGGLCCQLDHKQLDRPPVDERAGVYCSCCHCLDVVAGE